MARAPLPEKTFPRGGRKPKNAHVKADFGIFKAKTVKKKNNKGHGRKLVVSEKPTIEASVVHDLAVNDIRPGMLLYGCIDVITEMDVQFSLPGNCRAIVPVVHLNEQFKKAVQNCESDLPTLSDFFQIGQFLPLVILERCGEHTRKFKASLEPAEINAKIPARLLQVGLALTGSVSSVEEHGYVVDLGIPRVTAFLRKDNVDSVPRKGQLVRVFVESLSEDHLRIQLAMKSRRILDYNEQFPVNCFVPGMQAKLMVSKVLKGGIQVFIKGLGPDVTGFIHGNYLPKMFDKCLNYPEGTELAGTVLYVMPVINFPFFVANNREEPTWKLSYGELIQNAKVMNVTDAGLTVKVKKDGVLEKCFVPVARVNERNKILDKNWKLNEFYQKGSTLKTMRVERPSRLGRFYFAAIDRDSLKEAFYSKSDLTVGQKVKCTLAVIGENYCTVELSKHVKGFVPSVHMTEIPGIDYSSKFKVGQTVNGRILSLGEDGKNARVTLKPSLLKAKMLTGDTQVKPGEKYPGTVCKIFNRKILVEFFGGRVGEILKENMTLAHHGSTIQDSFKIGQVVNCYIVSSDEQKLALSLICNQDVADFIQIGQNIQTTVAEIADDGVYVDVRLKNNEIYPGFIPNGFISDYKGVWTQKKKLWQKGEKLSAFCVYCDRLRNPPILLSVHPTIVSFKQGKLSLNLGTVFPCVFIPGANITTPAVKYNADYEFQIKTDFLTKYRVLQAKIVDVAESQVICAANISEIWDGHYRSSFANMSSFFQELDTLRQLLKKSNHPLANLDFGRHISAKLDGETLRTKNGSVAKCWNEVDSKVSGRIAWIDLCGEIIWIHPDPKSGPVEVKTESREFIHAKIIHTCTDAIVAEAAGSHELVFIPTRRHQNDGKSHSNAYKVHESVKLCIERINGKLFGIDRKIAKRKMTTDLETTTTAKKRKTDDEILVAYEKTSGPTVDPVKMEVLSDDEEVSHEIVAATDESDTEIKSEVDSVDDPAEAVESLDSPSDSEGESDVKTEPPVALNVGFDWAAAANPALLQANRKTDSESSSDDEDLEATVEKKKRKRLTGAERKEKAKEAEERLRHRELELVDTARPPQTPDDFDRLVMTAPDNSAVWLQYMAHHLQETEIEKARAVARRALKTISFREENEKRNVWLALLNLEQLYGDADSQKSVLEEALRCNDPYKIHLHKLNMLVDNGAGLEAEKLANVLLKKYSANEDVWPDVGGALMKIGKIDYARGVLKRAMTTLPNTKHVALISKFAKLESKYGSGERAQTLYEQILHVFPKRVDVWSAYVDLMVKTGQIDLARQILERAVSQSLPLKKMKTIFKKFIAFEEANGTPENVGKVRQAAAEFLDNITGGLD